MNRAEHLKKDENCAGKRERTRKGITAFDRPDKNAHGNGERRRKSAPQQQGQPPCQGKARSGPGQDGEKLPLDRKSTRLNSSHGYISYAVFCLKKKKKPHGRQLTSSQRYNLLLST